MPAFVPEISVLVTFAVASIVLAITPGPDMALFISRTINHGRTHGIVSVLGASTGLFVHICLAAFGISLLLVAMPTAFFALKLAGALYLLWLAIQAVRQGGGIALAQNSSKKPSLFQTYLTGVGINLTNPKVALFFVTFLPQFVSMQDPDAIGKILFLGGEFLLLSLPIVIMIVFGAEQIGAMLTQSSRVQRALNWTFASVFAGFAVAIFALEGQR